MITGDRVTLRAITPDDYARLAQYRNDLELELLGGGGPIRPRPPAVVAEFFDQLVKDRGQFTFAIEADGTLIGDTGLFHLDQVSGTAEVGIGIGDRDYWSRGYGREALNLIVDFGFQVQNLRKIWLQVHGSNERAIRSYRAAGFVEEGRQIAHVWSGGRYEDLVSMARFRDPRPE